MITPIKLVLDTNVVLDWLLFEDVSTDVLREGLRDKWITVVTHPLAFDELRRVLTYSQFELDRSRQEALLDVYRMQTSIAALPEGYSLDHLMLPDGFPRCRDRDDDPFLALAHHTGADALVSKDKAVLRLRKRARKFGLQILNVLQLIEMGRAREWTGAAAQMDAGGSCTKARLRATLVLRR